jgi:hypothetical protein
MRLLLLAFAVSVFLAACTAEPGQNLPSGGSDDSERTEQQKRNDKQKNGPIQDKQMKSIADQSAEEVFGWLDDETVIFSAHNVLKSHNLFTGKETVIFQSDGSITDVQVNPEKKRLLIQSAAGSEAMKLSLVNEKGALLFSKTFNGYEFQASWNPFDPDLIYLTAFKEDWSYTTFLIHADQNKAEQQSLEIPFANWSSEDTLEYLKWNTKEPETSAPLYRYNLTDDNEEKIYDKVVAFEVFSDIRMAVKEPSEGDVGTFLFSETENGSPLSQYSQPLSSNYSSWDPGEYDYDSKTKSLYLFDQDQLKKIDVVNGNEKVVFSGIDMETICLSPNGNYALYGYTLQQVISFHDKKIVNLLNEGDE